jgi:hypothetical protein
MHMLRALATLLGATLFVIAGVAFVITSERALIERADPDQLVSIERGCAACGWIESQRTDQYTVRMRDGSSRVFDEIPGVKWRLGERLIYIN